MLRRLAAAVTLIVLASLPATAQISPGTATGLGGTSSAYGSAFPASGTAIGVQNSTGTAMTFLKVDASNNLNVFCANCSGSGVSAADKAVFTAGTSLFAPGGGFFQTTATSNPLTTGQQGMVQMTATRAFFVNPRDSSGNEIIPATSLAQGSTTAGQTGTLVLCAVQNVAPSYTNGQSSPCSQNTFGYLRVDAFIDPTNFGNFVVAGGASSGILSGFGNATNYAANVAMGGIQTISSFRTNQTSLPYTGTLANIAVGIKSNTVTSPVVVWVFSACPISGANACGVTGLTGTLGASCTDNTTFSLGSALPYLVGTFIITPAAVGGNSTATWARSDVAIAIKNQDLAANGGVSGLPTSNLYACYVAGASGVNLVSSGASPLTAMLAVSYD